MSDDLPLLPHLTVTSGPLQGASFRLQEGRWTIGRADGVDIVIDSFAVSGHHAVVELADGRVTLTDNDFTTGTWLNERQVSGTEELRDGDCIRLGGVELRFYDPAGARTEPMGTRSPSTRLAPPRSLAPVRESASKTAKPPAEAMTPRPRLGRVLLMIGGVVLAGCVAWAYLVLR